MADSCFSFPLTDKFDRFVKTLSSSNEDLTSRNPASREREQQKREWVSRMLLGKGTPLKVDENTPVQQNEVEA